MDIGVQEVKSGSVANRNEKNQHKSLILLKFYGCLTKQTQDSYFWDRSAKTVRVSRG
jgi:hypothetical protein